MDEPRSFDHEKLCDAAIAVDDGVATAEQREELFAWAVAVNLGRCCEHCGAGLRERGCHCWNHAYPVSAQ